MKHHFQSPLVSARSRALRVPSPGPHCLPRPLPTGMGSMSSRSSSSEKTVEMIGFLLRDFLPEISNFMEVSESSMQIGDIVLFNMESSSNTSTRFKHAAVCCGKGEVIHFQDMENSRRGRIIKEGFQVMRRQRGKCKVLRKKDGVNLESLEKKVTKLMNSTAEYSLLNNNCINFALYLLDLGHFSFQSQNSHGEELNLPSWIGYLLGLLDTVQ